MCLSEASYVTLLILAFIKKRYILLVLELFKLIIVYVKYPEGHSTYCCSGLKPTSPLCPWDFPGKNIGVVYHFLLQGFFLTQGSNLCLLHWRQILYCLSHQGCWFTGIGLSHQKEGTNAIYSSSTDGPRDSHTMCDPSPSESTGKPKPIPSPGDPPEPGIEPVSPALQANSANSLPAKLPWKPFGSP